MELKIQIAFSSFLISEKKYNEFKPGGDVLVIIWVTGFLFILNTATEPT